MIVVLRFIAWEHSHHSIYMHFSIYNMSDRTDAKWREAVEKYHINPMVKWVIHSEQGDWVNGTLRLTVVSNIDQLCATWFRSVMAAMGERYNGKAIVVIAYCTVCKIKNVL